MNCRGLWFFSIKVFWGRSAHGGVALSSKPARRSSLSSELANAISSQGAEPLLLLTSQREARLGARSLRLPGKILSASRPPAPHFAPPENAGFVSSPRSEPVACSTVRIFALFEKTRKNFKYAGGFP